MEQIGGFVRSLRLVKTATRGDFLCALGNSEDQIAAELFHIAGGADINRTAPACDGADICSESEVVIERHGADWNAEPPLTPEQEHQFEMLLALIGGANECLDPSLWRMQKFKGFVHYTLSGRVTRVIYIPAEKRGSLTVRRIAAFRANIRDAIEASAHAPRALV
jgi:hypothetical protein